MSAELEGVFDPSQYNPTMGGGQSLPVSDKNGHLVKIVDSEMKQTQTGTGSMLALTCRIIEGPNAGQEGNWNLNIGNANVTAVRIAQQELACVCHAVGQVGPLQSTAPLHDKPFRVVVVAQTGEGGEKGFTNVTKVLRADGSKLTEPAGSGGAAPAPGPAPSQPPTQAAPAQQAGGFPVSSTVAPPQQAQPQAAPQQQQQAAPQAWPAQQPQAAPQQQQQAAPQAPWNTAPPQ